MLPITPRCAGLLLIVCAAIQGATIDDDEPEQEPKNDAVVLVDDIVLVFKESGLGLDCRNVTTCGDSQTCNTENGVCECLPGYQWALTLTRKQQTCKKCPVLHEVCGDEGCCFPENTTRCYHNICQCKYELGGDCSPGVDQFKLATQIALVSAIILVIACLLVILWRTCRKQHGQRQRRRMQRRSDASEASLTSVQQRVVERLRNRPPGYHDRTHIRIEKPPSYEETIGQPLRYPALVLDPVRYPLEDPVSPSQEVSEPSEDCETSETPVAAVNVQLVTEEADAPCGGVDNSAFVDDEQESKQGPSPEMHM